MKTETKHTPGPWRLEEGSAIMATHPKLGRVQIAILARTRWSHPDQRNNAILEATRDGDAALIASAPDMAREIAQLKAERSELLEALQALLLPGEYKTPEGTVENLFPKRFNQAKTLITKHSKV